MFKKLFQLIRKFFRKTETVAKTAIPHQPKQAAEKRPERRPVKYHVQHRGPNRAQRRFNARLKHSKRNLAKQSFSARVWRYRLELRRKDGIDRWKQDNEDGRVFRQMAVNLAVGVRK